MSELDQALEAAQEVARRPVQDRLNGRAGNDAERAVLRLAVAAGMTYRDASRLAEALWFGGWNAHQDQVRNETKES